MVRQNRFIRQNLYQLKLQFGVPLKLVRRLPNPVRDLRTGTTEYEYEKYDLDRAVLLPTKELTNKQWSREEQEFSRGGYFEVGTRTFIVDTHDLPVDFKIQEDDYLVYDSRRYDIFSIEDYEEMRAFLLIGREVKTTGPLFDIFCPKMEPTELVFTATAAGVVM